MTPPQRPPILIGVDGGASGVRALAVAGAGADLRAEGPLVAEDYSPAAGFAPAPLDRQRAEQRAPVLGPAEREQGERWVAAAARCIAGAAQASAPEGGRRVLVGVALPGLKTADGRGTRVVKNGPRVPDYLSRLEAQLVSVGCTPARPLGPLESDGPCAAIGEQRAADGALRGVSCGYYLGGGSGLAEALVLEGEALALEAAGDGFERAWELRCGPGGESYEDLVAPGAVNARWRERSGREGLAEEFPERHLETDVLAVAALTDQATQLARLVHQRLAALTARGYRPERAVVGQRLGLLLADRRTEFYLRRTAARELARLLYFDADARLARQHLVPGADGVCGSLAPGLLLGSSLRAAPALGAAWLAASRGEVP